MLTINNIDYTNAKIILDIDSFKELTLESDSQRVHWEILQYPNSTNDKTYLPIFEHSNSQSSIVSPEKFIPVVSGNYYLKVVERSSKGNYSQTNLYLKVSNSITDSTIPMSGETTEFDNEFGWSKEIEQNLQSLSQKSEKIIKGRCVTELNLTDLVFIESVNETISSGFTFNIQNITEFTGSNSQIGVVIEKIDMNPELILSEERFMYVILFSGISKVSDEFTILTDTNQRFFYDNTLKEISINSSNVYLGMYDDTHKIINIETNLMYSTLSGGGSSGGLIVSELDGSPSESVSQIVFNGRTDSNGETVNIVDGVAYINSVAPPLNLGGDLTLTNNVLYTGRVSQSNINYETTYGVEHDYLTMDANFSLRESEFNNASIGNLEVFINGIVVANLDLSSNFNEVNRSTNQDMNDYNIQGSGNSLVNGVITFSGGTLTLESVRATGAIDSDAYQMGAFTIELNPIALRQGYNYIETSHNGNSNNIFRLFYDTDSNSNPEVHSTELLVNSLVSNFISGIEYCNTGTSLYATAIVENAFDNVYHSSNAPIIISSNINISDTISYTDSSVTGVSTPPDISESMIITNKEYIIPINQEDSNTRLTFTPRDPYSTYTNYLTPENNILTMSMSPTSDASSEFFIDETYRFDLSYDFNIVPLAITGRWNSQLPLGANDLQVYDTYGLESQSLIHPHDDLTGTIPANPDYSVLSGGLNKHYVRVFQGSQDNSNGILTINGITDLDLGTNVMIHIKVPSKTDWLNISNNYNMSSFSENARFVNNTWQTTTYAVGDWIIPTISNGNKYRCSAISTGQSGDVEPNWVTDEILDEGVTWTRYQIDSDEGCRINPGSHSIDSDNSIEFTLGEFSSDSSVNRVIFVRITYASVSIPNVISNEFSINW